MYFALLPLHALSCTYTVPKESPEGEKRERGEGGSRKPQKRVPTDGDPTLRPSGKGNRHCRLLPFTAKSWSTILAEVTVHTVKVPHRQTFKFQNLLSTTIPSGAGYLGAYCES